jgi:hypothetical protein
MRRVRGRSILAVFAVAIVAAACTPAPSPARPTTVVAAATDSPTPATSQPVEPTSEPSPGPTTDPNAPPPPSIEPGEVDRSSLNVSATYDVNALISVGSGAIEMAARIEVKNESGESIDRLELNTVAARLGLIEVTESSVDGKRVKTRVNDQTLVVPLDGVLPDGATATILIGYRATLSSSLAGSDWMFSKVGGTIAMHRWIPWVSRAIPFGRPRAGPS